MRIKARYPMQSVERHTEATRKGLQLFSRQIPVLFLDRLELVYDHGLAISALEFTVSCRNITALPSQRQLLPQRHQSEILLLGEAHLIRMERLMPSPRPAGALAKE